MSMNNSKCWCPATVLGPTNTAATCSTVVGTTETKEQHWEDEMHLQFCKTGPAVRPVLWYGSTPMAVHLF